MRAVRLFVVRRRGCGCLLGSVVRTEGRDLLIANSRDLVAMTVDRTEAQSHTYTVDLDAPSDDFDAVSLGCKHSAGKVEHLLPLRRYRDQVAKGAKRRGTVYVVK